MRANSSFTQRRELTFPQACTSQPVGRSERRATPHSYPPITLSQPLQPPQSRITNALLATARASDKPGRLTPISGSFLSLSLPREQLPYTRNFILCAFWPPLFAAKPLISMGIHVPKRTLWVPRPYRPIRASYPCAAIAATKKWSRPKGRTNSWQGMGTRRCIRSIPQVRRW